MASFIGRQYFYHPSNLPEVEEYLADFWVEVFKPDDDYVTEVHKVELVQGKEFGGLVEIYGNSLAFGEYWKA